MSVEVIWVALLFSANIMDHHDSMPKRDMPTEDIQGKDEFHKTRDVNVSLKAP